MSESNIDEFSESLDARKLSIQRCIQSISHACKCRDTKCRLPSCQRMKRVLLHTKACKLKVNGNCPICKQLIALCFYHAKYCQDTKCSVPICSSIKQKMKQRQLQQRVKQAQSSSVHTGSSSSQSHSTNVPNAVYPTINMSNYQGESRNPQFSATIPQNTVSAVAASNQQNIIPSNEFSLLNQQQELGSSKQLPQHIMDSGSASAGPTNQTTAGSQNEAPSVAMEVDQTPNNHQNRSSHFRVGMQQLEEALEQPSSQQQHDRICQIIKSYPQLMVAFSAFMKVMQQQQQEDLQKDLTRQQQLRDPEDELLRLIAAMNLDTSNSTENANVLPQSLLSPQEDTMHVQVQNGANVTHPSANIPNEQCEPRYSQLSMTMSQNSPQTSSNTFLMSNQRRLGEPSPCLRLAMQQLLHNLRLPSSPLLEEQILQMMKINPQLFAAIIKQRQQQPPQSYGQSSQPQMTSLSNVSQLNAFSMLCQPLQNNSSGTSIPVGQIIGDGTVGVNFTDRTAVTLSSQPGPSNIGMQVPQTPGNSQQNQMQQNRQAMLQLLQTLRLSSSPQQKDQILQILKTNPQFMAAFIKQKQQLERSLGQPSQQEMSYGQPSMMMSQNSTSTMAVLPHTFPMFNQSQRSNPPGPSGLSPQQTSVGDDFPNQTVSTSHAGPSEMRMPTPQTPGNCQQNRLPIHRQVLQQLLQTLRLPSSPQQQDQVLQILKANPQLMTAFIKQRQQQQQQQQKSQVGRMNTVSKDRRK